MPQQVTTSEGTLGVNAGGIEQRQAKASVTPVVAANETTVSATLKDLGGIIWAGALITINFMPAPNIPGPYMWGGGPFTLNPRLTADSNGHFSISLPDNTTITPSGSTWQFVIAPAATMPAVIFNLMIAGATMDISSVFTSQSYQVSLGTVQSLPLPRAYTNSDVATPPNTGQLYYNTTSQNVMVWGQTQQTGNVPTWLVLLGGSFTDIASGTDLNLLAGNGFFAGANLLNAPIGATASSQSVSQLGLVRFFTSSDDPTHTVWMGTWSNAFAQWGPWIALTGMMYLSSTQSQDLNDYIYSNQYIFGSGFTANGPSNITNSSFSILEVYNMPGPTYLQRLSCPVDPTHYTSIYHRVYNGAWSPWYELTGTQVP